MYKAIPGHRTSVQKILISNDGSAMPLILSVIFFCMTLTAALWHYNILFHTIYSVRNAAQATVITAITRNSEETFAAKREAYSGAWLPAGGEWVEVPEKMDSLPMLCDLLGLNRNGDTLVKLNAAGGTLYYLRDISLDIYNPALEASTPLAARLRIVVHTQIRLPMVGETAIELPIVVYAKNPTRF